MASAGASYSRRDFLALVMDYSLYGFGMSFASMVTILPAFVYRLSSSNVLIGLITSIAVLGFNAPQIFVTNYVEKLRARKPFMMLYTLGERLPWLVLAALTALMSGGSSSALLTVFFALYAVANVSAGIVAPAWFDLVARVVPDGRRGWYFGTANFLSAVLGVAGGAAAGWLIHAFGFPLGYAVCFFMTFLLSMASYVALWMVREPDSNAVGKGDGLSKYLSSIPNMLREDRVFARYVLATVVSGITVMAPAFYTAHALNTSGGGEANLALYSAIYFASQVLSNFVWAHLGDTRGHVVVVMSGSLFGAVAGVVAILSTDVVGFGLGFVLLGLSMSGFMVSWFPAVMELAPEERRPTYLAVAGVLRSVPASLAPLLGGAIADSFGYAWIFGIASASHLVTAAVVLWTIRSMTRRRKAETGALTRQQPIIAMEPRP